MENQKLEIMQPNKLQMRLQLELDSEVGTAKAYPRDIMQCINRIAAIATMDSETATECFYSVKRADGQVEGISVNFARILCNIWGNLKISTQIVENNGKTITVRGIGRDLESNNTFSMDVMRNITTRDGRTYSHDMQTVTAMAAQAVAYRNVVMGLVPKALLKRVIDLIKEKAREGVENPSAQWGKIAGFFASKGIPEGKMLSYISLSSPREITADHIVELRGLATAIQEGSLNAVEIFGEQERIAEGKALGQTNADTVRKAMAKARGGE